ncbi:hypothetical protein Tco_1355796 [Tanacetum coccineum]
MDLTLSAKEFHIGMWIWSTVFCFFSCMIYLTMSWLVDTVAATAVYAGVCSMFAFVAAIVLKVAYFPLFPVAVTLLFKLCTWDEVF